MKPIKLKGTLEGSLVQESILNIYPQLQWQPCYPVRPAGLVSTSEVWLTKFGIEQVQSSNGRKE